MSEVLTGDIDFYQLPTGNWIIKVHPPKNKYGFHYFEKEFSTFKEAKTKFDFILATARKCGLKITRNIP